MCYSFCIKKIQVYKAYDGTNLLSANHSMIAKLAHIIFSATRDSTTIKPGKFPMIVKTLREWAEIKLYTHRMFGPVRS